MKLSKTGIFSLLGAVFIWGSTFVITKALMNDMGPFTVTGLRLIVSIIAITPFALRKGYKWSMILEKQYIFFGLTGVALYFGLANTGLARSTSANAALIQSVNPAAVALLSILFLKEKVNLQRGIGVGLSVLGVVLISGVPTIQGQATLFGNVLIIGSVLAWAVYTIQGKKLTGNADPLATTTASFYTGLFWLLPFIGWEIAHIGMSALPMSSWLALVYLGVFGSALAFFLWNNALQRVDASIAGPFINLIPIIGLLLAMIVGEKISLIQVIGGIIAILGVLITQNIFSTSKG